MYPVRIYNFDHFVDESIRIYYIACIGLSVITDNDKVLLNISYLIKIIESMGAILMHSKYF